MQRQIHFFFDSWKNSSSRKPLLVRGARQVGKSYSIREFGKSKFENLVEVNFELRREVKKLFSVLDPNEIVRSLSAFLNEPIIPGRTLLFFDEIQECPDAILSLRYFYELMPDLHVMAAGSLLESIINSDQYRSPVGRIQYAFMQPLSFDEVLEAKNEQGLLTYKKELSLKTQIPQPIHEKLLSLTKEYALIGGMPESVNSGIMGRTVEQQNIQTAIIQTYHDDFGKYANRVKHNYLHTVLATAPAVIGQRYKYSNIDRETGARELKEALSLLCQAGVINKVRASSGQGLPLEASVNERKFKILLLDIGLMQRSLNLESTIALNPNFIAINSGALAEQFVGQELIANSSSWEQVNLYFWVQDKKNSEAEVDYLVVSGSDIFPLEVKAGSAGRLKSLYSYLNTHKAPFGIRVSQQELSYDNKVLSIPFYALGDLPRLINDAKNSSKN